MAKTAQSIDANTFAFFTRNPRGGAAKAIDPEDIKRFEEVCKEAGIDKIVAHGSYTINPCSAKESVREFALQALEMCIRDRITVDNARELAGTGIAGIAVVSAIFAQADLAGAVERLSKVAEAL